MAEDNSYIDDTNMEVESSEVISAETLISEEWEPPSKCIKDCFEKSFNVEGLRGFCQDYFNQLYTRLDPHDGYDAIMRKLIDYCEHYGRTEELWESLRASRPHNYDEYYPRWRRSKASYSGRTDEFAMLHRSVVASERPPSGGSPLAQDEPEFSSWFFTVLTPDERSLLLATALFEGMVRTKLVQTAKDLEPVIGSAR